MKPIKFNAILSGVSTKSDGSLSLRISTPEFTAEETTVMMKLTRINLDCTLQPLGDEVEPPVETKRKLAGKTPGQRIRACLYVLFEHEQRLGLVADGATFDQFYEQRCEKIIAWLKRKLPEIDHDRE